MTPEQITRLQARISYIHKNFPDKSRADLGLLKVLASQRGITQEFLNTLALNENQKVEYYATALEAGVLYQIPLQWGALPGIEAIIGELPHDFFRYGLPKKLQDVALMAERYAKGRDEHTFDDDCKFQIANALEFLAAVGKLPTDTNALQLNKLGLHGCHLALIEIAVKHKQEERLPPKLKRNLASELSKLEKWSPTTRLSLDLAVCTNRIDLLPQNAREFLCTEVHETLANRGMYHDIAWSRLPQTQRLTLLSGYYEEEETLPAFLDYPEYGTDFFALPIKIQVDCCQWENLLALDTYPFTHQPTHYERISQLLCQDGGDNNSIKKGWLLELAKQKIKVGASQHAAQKLPDGRAYRVR